jgi:hypothetical protein
MRRPRPQRWEVPHPCHLQASWNFTVERLFNFTTSSGPGSFEGTIHFE